MKAIPITIVLLTILSYIGQAAFEAGHPYWQAFGFLMIMVFFVCVCYLVAGWKVKRNG